MTFSVITRCTAINYLYPIHYKEIVYEYADYYGIDRTLVFSIIKVESDFNQNAQSNAGAIGLMQITESTGKYIANMMQVENYDLKDETVNVEFGCYYLKYLTNKFKITDTAIAAYNAGEGNVSLWLKNSEYSNDGKTLKYIPFLETREYVKKINQTFSKYKKLYGNILDKNKNFE